MSKSRFYVCEKCGNTVGMIHDKGVPLVCCGRPMTHLEPTGGNVKVEYVGNAVRVTASKGDRWVYLATDRGGQRKMLDTDGSRELTFSLCEESPKAVYAYNGGTGLSKTQI